MHFLFSSGVRLLIVACVLIILGIGIGYWVLPHKKSLSVHATDVRQQNYGGQFTSQLLECAELPQHISIGQRVELEKDITALIKKGENEGVLAKAAVYFRDLNNGPWFGVNEDTPFYPASLLKLPLAMGIYWQAEDDPRVLTQQGVYESDRKDHEAQQAFGSDIRLQDGATYTVAELIDIMLQESNNEAALILSQIVGEDRILQVYRDFNITPPTPGQDYRISSHTFASFFRILFNATYLDRVFSEKLLETMTHSSFVRGIVAGVPNTVKVAHKFGTREIDATGTRQLHDCGIIYAPSKPYTLCVMTEGTDYDALADFIADVSRLVYENVAE